MTDTAKRHFDGARAALQRNDARALLPHLIGLLNALRCPVEPSGVAASSTVDEEMR